VPVEDDESRRRHSTATGADTISSSSTIDDRDDALRLALAVLMIVLPSRLRRHLGRLLLGWDIDPTAHIGRSIIVVDHLSMGPGAVIGSWNVIRYLDELRLGEGASIATRNWIAAHPQSAEVFPHSPNRTSSLILGKHAMITVGHEIDCSDRVELGDYAAFAGFRSQILTHSLNLVRDIQVTGPVELGERSAVMSACLLLSGTCVPPRSIVSAGSVVTTKLTKDRTFYRGNPAVAVRELPDNLRYFHRGEADADQPG
jgi:acetyltransferase-like isoleucine patch superfamily enzyme